MSIKQDNIINDPIELKRFNKEIDGLFQDLIYEIEEDRYEPSERGAGTAPTGRALSSAFSLVLEIVDKFQTAGITPAERNKRHTFDDIVSYLSNQDDEDCIESVGFVFLEMISDADRDPKAIHYKKYYEHGESNRCICVETWSSRDGEYTSRDNGDLLIVSEVTKKEITTYEWV